MDEKIASRIKNNQINDIRNQKSQIAGTNIGIFSSSLIDDGSNIWKSLEGNVVQWYDKSKVDVNNVAKTANDATGIDMGYVENKGLDVKNGLVNEASNAWNEIKGSADAALSFTGSTIGETFNNLIYKPMYALGKGGGEIENKLTGTNIINEANEDFKKNNIDVTVNWFNSLGSNKTAHHYGSIAGSGAGQIMQMYAIGAAGKAAGVASKAAPIIQNGILNFTNLLFTSTVKAYLSFINSEYVNSVSIFNDLTVIVSSFSKIPSYSTPKFNL